VGEVIVPALRKRAVVVCDRFSDATLAYQGYGNRVDLGMIRKIDTQATEGLAPDLTILLDIESSRGLRRATAAKTDRIERRALSYHRRVRRGYLAIARGDRRRVRVIRVDRGIAGVQALVRQAVERLIARYAAD